VIERIRALSKKRAFENVRLDINQVIDDVIALIRREINVHGVTLWLDLGVSLPTGPMATAPSCQQVIMNLLMNGIQAMSAVKDRDRETADPIARARVRSDAHYGGGFRRRNRAGTCRPAVQRLLHDEAGWHGHGTIDLPFDHRSPRWPTVGTAKRTPRRHVSVSPAAGRRQCCREVGAASALDDATVEAWTIYHRGFVQGQDQKLQGPRHGR